MAAKNLKPEEMVQISAGWLDPQNDGHKAILLVPILVSALPLISEAHAGVLPLVKPPQNDRLAAIMSLEAVLDVRHDGIIRGIYGALTWMADLIGGDEGTALLMLRDQLLPDGQQSMLKSYRAEATQAAQLEEQLTPALRARTDAILIGEGATAKRLTVFLDEWIAIGKELSALEDEKGRIEAAAAVGESVSGTTFLKARNFWVRVVNALVANADLVDVDADKKATIFGPLWNAEKKADERARQAAKNRPKPPEEKTAGEKAAAEKAAGEKAAAEKAAAEKAAGDKDAAADKGAADKGAAEKVAESEGAAEDKGEGRGAAS